MEARPKRERGDFKMILEKNEKIQITESMIPAQMSVTIADAKEMVKIFTDLRMRCSAAIKEISTKLDILDREFSVRQDHNPIHHMESRLKSINSIAESVYKITDLAGVRVVCNYIDDIYKVEDSLLRQDDIKLIKRKDYIKNPKESGYRSLHLVVEVPIFLSDRTYHMPVEIQIRTIAMDTWASLEHEIKYKRKEDMPKEVADELKQCAKSMAEVDATMERIHKMF